MSKMHEVQPSGTTILYKNKREQALVFEMLSDLANELEAQGITGPELGSKLVRAYAGCVKAIDTKDLPKELDWETL